MKDALTTTKTAQSAERIAHSENLTEYFYCALRKNEARISVAICHKQRCMWLESEGGKFRCNHENCGDPKRGGRRNAR